MAAECSRNAGMVAGGDGGRWRGWIFSGLGAVELAMRRRKRRRRAACSGGGFADIGERRGRVAESEKCGREWRDCFCFLPMLFCFDDEAKLQMRNGMGKRES